MPKLTVLFLCIENSCRSQMAEGFAKKLAGDKLGVFSAGSNPSGIVSSKAIAVMKEVDIDISKQKSKGFADLPQKGFDCIVTMGCGDVCPYYPSKEKLDWQVEDPKAQDIEFYRKTRDQIKEKVKEFIARRGLS